MFTSTSPLPIKLPTPNLVSKDIPTVNMLREPVIEKNPSKNDKCESLRLPYFLKIIFRSIRTHPTTIAMTSIFIASKNSSGRDVDAPSPAITLDVVVVVTIAAGAINTLVAVSTAGFEEEPCQ